MRPAGPPSDQFLDRACISNDSLSRQVAVAVWKRWHSDHPSVIAFRYWVQTVIAGHRLGSDRTETIVAVMQRAYAELSGVFPD